MSLLSSSFHNLFRNHVSSKSSARGTLQNAHEISGEQVSMSNLLQKLLNFDSVHLIQPENSFSSSADNEPSHGGQNGELAAEKEDSQDEQQVKSSQMEEKKESPVFPRSDFEYDPSEEPVVPSSALGVQEVMSKIRLTRKRHEDKRKEGLEGAESKLEALPAEKNSNQTNKKNRKGRKQKRNNMDKDQFISLAPITAVTGKRKRNDTTEEEATLVVDKTKKSTLSNEPWILASTHQPDDAEKEATISVPENPLLWLHNEILHFAEFITAKEDEMQARSKLVKTIETFIQEIFPEAVVTTFGSFVTGLCLPCSDVDINISNCPDDAIFKVARVLQYRGLVESLDVAENAKVPVIKCVLIDTAYSCDISFQSKPPPTEHISAMDSIPLAKPLILVLKYFFLQRDKHQTIKGGFGSHFIALSVLSVIQHSKRLLCSTNGQRVLNRLPKGRKPTSPAEQHLKNNYLDLGSLLLEYFNLFSKTLNTHEVTVLLRKGGKYVSSRGSKGPSSAKISLLNPEDETSDVGSAVFQYTRNRQVFIDVYRQLLFHLNAFHKEQGYRTSRKRKKLAQASNPASPNSILKAVVRSDQTLTERYMKYYQK